MPYLTESLKQPPDLLGLPAHFVPIKSILLGKTSGSNQAPHQLHCVSEAMILFSRLEFPLCPLPKPAWPLAVFATLVTTPACPLRSTYTSCGG